MAFGAQKSPLLEAMRYTLFSEQLPVGCSSRLFSKCLRVRIVAAPGDQSENKQRNKLNKDVGLIPVSK